MGENPAPDDKPGRRRGDLDAEDGKLEAEKPGREPLARWAQSDRKAQVSVHDALLAGESIHGRGQVVPRRLGYDGVGRRECRRGGDLLVQAAGRSTCLAARRGSAGA